MTTYAPPDDEIQAPADYVAERSLIGGALLHRAVRELLLAEVPSDAFNSPGHRHVAAVIYALSLRGDVVDPSTVRAELIATGRDRSDLLLACGADAVGLGSARHLAGVVLDRWARRTALNALRDAQAACLDPSVPLDRLADWASVAVEAAAMPSIKTNPAINVEDFLAIQDADERWLVPGLLEHGDRTIITGQEGGGKSTFLRTFAAQVAAGMHPFTGKLIEPKRVLVIDLENSDRQVRRSLRPIWGELKRQGFPGEASNLRLEIRGQALDLLNSPVDQRWLLSVCEANKPDLVVTGPLYKLGGTSNKDDEAARVVKVLDEVRKRWNCALLLEAHAPHGDSAGPHGRNLRPFGASLWLRWPEFGFGMSWHNSDPARFQLSPWRGAREVRDWPKAVYRTGQNIPWGVRPEDQA